MLDLGLIGFTTPWVLAALALLPALYWLLRVIPPTPRRVRFPAIRFLFGIQSREETPARTPPWLLALRLLIATLVILALAGPLLYPEPELEGDGPLVLVVDDGWAAAPGWERRVEALERFTQRAVRDGREIVLAGTAPDPAGQPLRRLSATDAAKVVPSWAPKPWPVDRAAALDGLRGLGDGLDDAEIVWLSDGIADGGDGAREARAFAEGLGEIGRLRALTDPQPELAPLLLPPETGGTEGLDVAALRPAAGPALTVSLRALGPGGEVLAQQPLTFAAGERRGEARLDLPLELRNRIARLELAPARGIGGVVLLDERWRRRVVGLVGDSLEGDTAQPLLSQLYYVERALNPYTELRRGAIEDLLAGRLSALVLGDAVVTDPTARERLEEWIEEGGLLVRFAGPRLAAGGDGLVPVDLRLGDRNLGGALSWERPQPLASFDGPLAGLRVPDDVLVSRQVLAQPGPELAKRTWARLGDGTPLITAEQRGKGWLVLVHTTANTIWSNLPLSGAFVDILRRVVALAPGVGGQATGTLTLLETLDARGRLTPPVPTAQPLPAERLAETPAGPLHPAGLYGRPGAGEDAHRVALNLASAVADPTALDAEAFTVRPRAYAASAEIDLLPWLLLAALLLAFADTVIGLALRGLLPAMPGRRRPAAGGAAAASALLLTLLLPAAPALAQEPQQPEGDDMALVEATAETHLAYVLTGIDEVDETSRTGLEGLSLVLNQRTAVEAAEPLPVDLERDDLAIYPLLYWPVPADHPDLGPEAVERVDAYLRQGGMILFDTGDTGVLLPGQPGPGPGEQRLRELLGRLNLAPLTPVPEDHALTKSFYLLQEFPGRFTGQEIWVDQVEAGVNDGVSSVVIGGNDWAGAWAIDELGQALLPVMPGGERQREMARRFGVNLVMYALTGNYKTDQVHVPAILERLGQ